ncbi:MAG: ankyrin repeat domain-containing protein [Saprospiraceae bacterium]|nr:ankyrin repeat domain-containing protein [Saprospiraceae bacterium]
MKITETYFTACSNGNLEVVKFFLETGKLDIDERSPEGWTGLIISCFNQQFEIAKFLIDNKADINATNLKGTSVFMYAKTPILKNQNNTKILELLMDAGAEINHLDSFNKSVLDYVIDNGSLKLGKWLILMGAKHGKAILKKE